MSGPSFDFRTCVCRWCLPAVTGYIRFPVEHSTARKELSKENITNLAVSLSLQLHFAVVVCCAMSGGEETEGLKRGVAQKEAGDIKGAGPWPPTTDAGSRFALDPCMGADGLHYLSGRRLGSGRNSKE